MIITEEQFKAAFGANAVLLGNNVSHAAPGIGKYHDITQSEGYVDENNYFHPIGNEPLKERNKWLGLKKGIPKIQEYINAGVPEEFIKGKLEFLARTITSPTDNWQVSTQKVMNAFEEIYQRNKKAIEDKAKMEKEIAEKPPLTPEEEEAIINSIAEKMATQQPKEITETQVLKNTPVMKMSTEEQGTVYEEEWTPGQQAKKQGILAKLMGQLPVIDPKGLTSSMRLATLSDQIKSNIGAYSPGELVPLEDLYPGAMIAPSYPPVLRGTDKITLSGALVFDRADIQSCINGKLILKSEKRPIQLSRKQQKELDKQL